MPRPRHNRFVAAGSFGCVYAPPISQQQRDGTMGKLFAKGRSARHNQRSFEDELEANDLVRDINAEGRFTLTDIAGREGYVYPHALNHAEKMSCVATARDPAGRAQTWANLQRQVPQIVYARGGFPIYSLRQKNVPIARFLVHFQNIMQGLVRLNETAYAHMDIKPDNVLYDPRAQRAHLIDFGHFGPEDRLYADSLAHLALLGHHYPYYPPEFRVLFMFCMGDPDADTSRTLPVYHHTLDEEMRLYEGTYLDFPLHVSRLNLLFTRRAMTPETARMIRQVEDGIRQHMAPDIARKYEAVLRRFHHVTRLEHTQRFVHDHVRTWTYSPTRLGALEKMYLNARCGAKIDVYAVGVCLMEVVYDHIMPVFLGKHSTRLLSRKTHDIIIGLLYIVSGMVHPDPLQRLAPHETVWFYDILVEAIHARHRDTRDAYLERIRKGC